MVDVPFVEVSHLASSTSFYAAVLQPLGLKYLPPCTPAPVIIATSALYGGERGAIFAARQSQHPLKPPRLSKVVFATSSRSAVASFYSCALKANPPNWSSAEGVDSIVPYDARTWKAKGREPSLTTDSYTNQAIVYDLDGNRIEVIYQPQRRSSASSDKLGVRRCEPARVSDWDFDYESTIVGSRITMPTPMPSNRIGTGSSVAPSSIQSSVTCLDRQDPTSPRESSKPGGLSANAVMGTVLGVAAGAALAYGWFTSSNAKEEETPQPMPEKPHAGRGQMPRRHTYQESRTPRDSLDPDDPRAIRDPNDPRYVPTALVYVDETTPKRYDDFGNLPLRAGVQYGEDDENPWVNEPRQPQASSRAPSQVSRSHRFEEVQAPSQVSRHARAVEEPRAPSQVSRSRPADDDSRSHVSRHTARPSSGKPRSETRGSKSVHENSTERRSQAPSKRNGSSESVVSRPPTTTRGRREAYGGEVESVHTSRPQRSSSARRSEPRQEPDYVPKKGKPSSKASTAAVPRDSHRRSGSIVSKTERHTSKTGGAGRDSRGSKEAKEVPLPASGVGSSYVGYDDEPAWDDDLVSLAPSDSISCVGIKASRRPKHRH